jgi:LPS-assembly protein
MIIFATTVMKNTIKGKAKYICVFVCMALVASMAIANTFAILSYVQLYNTKLTIVDSLPPKKLLKNTSKPIVKSTPIVNKTDTLPKGNQNNNAKTDSIGMSVAVDTFDYKISKDALDGPVTYHADDSMVMDVPGKKIMLYGKKATTKYLDNELTAPNITFDQEKNVVSAYFIKDSTGKVISAPTFKQDGMITVSDTMAFNMKSGKGLTKGTYTQQGEMYIYGERFKKVDSNSFYAYKARFTTCNLDTPHFAFVSKKIKFVNNKFALTGPVHPEFEGIPLPLVLPFGIYPMSQGRHSGLIAPAFTSNAQFGLALEGLGYYKVLSDNWDVTLRGTLYSYGGWTANISPRYYKRYHYQGNFSVDVQKTKINFKGDPDFSKTNTYSLRWSHTADTKARPGVTFSASVNIASTKFNQLVPNNPIRNFNNQLNSSISYSKVWKDKPFNLQLVANHSQNTQQKTISFTLPDVSFNMNTLYPFRKKESVGTLKWYENIGIALNSNVKSQSIFSDDTAKDKRPIGTQIVQNYQWAATHSVPITLSLPPIGPLQVGPSVSYSERWYQQKLFQTWNPTAKKLDTAIQKGFFTAREIAFSVGVSTRIFGMIGFGKNAKVQAVRHEIRPTISASYTPDINRRFFYTMQVDTAGRLARLPVFSGNLNQTYGEGRFGGLSFGLDNNIQMKVRNKKDTSAEGIKKVTLIDGLSINSSYNFLSDSFQLTAFNLSARTNLFEKISITAQAVVDPYLYNDTTGRRINQLVWKQKALSLGKFMGGSISISSQFQGGDKTKKKNQSINNLPVNQATGLPLDENSAEARYIRTNPGEFADFSIPWSVNFGFSLRYTQAFDNIKKKFEGNTSSDLNFNGTLNLTPKWQIGLTGVYNFNQGDLGVLTMSISREMHCWQMSMNVSPLGANRFFNITISPKSALLRDVKINRTRYFFDL